MILCRSQIAGESSCPRVRSTVQLMPVRMGSSDMLDLRRTTRSASAERPAGHEAVGIPSRVAQAGPNRHTVDGLRVQWLSRLEDKRLVLPGEAALDWRVECECALGGAVI